MATDKPVKDFASALGEAVGKLIEDGIRSIVKSLVEEYHMEIYSGKLFDKIGIDFEIDLPIFKEGKPVALIDIKYLRYKKHARDKGSWIVVAHNRLKATFPTIKKSLVILLGTGWTDKAKKLISTSCTDIISVDPPLLDRILSEYNVRFSWDERDEETPKLSWQNFCKLTKEELDEIKERIIEESGIKEKIRNWFKKYILETDPEEKLKLDYTC